MESRQGRHRSILSELNSIATKLRNFFKSEKLQSEPVSNVDILPDETWLHILSLLESKNDLASVKLTCKRLNSVASDAHLNLFEDLSAVAVSPSGDKLAVANVEGREVVIMDMNGQRIASLYEKNKKNFRCHQVYFTKEDDCVVAAYASVGHFKFDIWDIASQTMTKQFRREDFFSWEHEQTHLCDIGQVNILSKGRFFFPVVVSTPHKDVAVPLANIRFYLCDIRSGKVELKSFGGTNDYGCIDMVSVSPDEKFLVLCQDKQIAVFDFVTEQRIQSLPIPTMYHNCKFTCAQITADNNVFIYAESKGKGHVIQYNIEANRLVDAITIPCQQSILLSRKMTISDDGRLMAMFNYKANEFDCFDADAGTIEVWDIKTKECIYSETCELAPMRLVKPAIFAGDNKVVIASHNRVHIQDMPVLALQSEPQLDEEKTVGARLAM